MEQTDILPERIRRLAIATGIASALALFPIFFLLYTALLIVGGAIQPRYPIAGKWLVWAAVANLGVVVVSYDAMMSPHPWRQPTSPAYMVLTFWATTALLIWCSAELTVDGLRRIWGRRSMPPRAPRPAGPGAWILAVVLTLFVGWNAKGWLLEPSRFRNPDIFYTLGLAIVQAVIVAAFDISLIRRVPRLRSASRANF